MTDRELLEMAAKSAGIEYDADSSKPNPISGVFFGLWLVIQGEPYQGQRRYWNPLTDDGDALRLAVKLRLWSRYRDDNSASVCWYDAKGFFAGNVTEEIGSLRNGDEPSAAVRRAIVRAAAEIGK